MKYPSFRFTLATGLLSLLPVFGAGTASAQTVFVSLAGKTSVAPVLTIPAPGNGWNYSAAAPVPGTQWNRIRRPAGVDITDPAIHDAGKAGAGKVGRFPLSEPTGVPLVDPDGKPTGARLKVSIGIASLADDKARVEPSVQSKSSEAAPVGLMENAWRIYLDKNSLTFTFSGLIPGTTHDLFLYGAASNPQATENPSGDGLGCRFTLALANVPPGQPASVETLGGYFSTLYTFNPETSQTALTPMGTTWTKVRAVVDSNGEISFSTSRNSNNRHGHFLNGFQLVDATP